VPKVITVQVVQSLLLQNLVLPEPIIIKEEQKMYMDVRLVSQGSTVQMKLLLIL